MFFLLHICRPSPLGVEGIIVTHMYLPMNNKVDVPWQNIHLQQLALVVLMHT
jgi:hypothetical protein